MKGASELGAPGISIRDATPGLHPSLSSKLEADFFKKKRSRREKNTHLVTKLMGKEGNPNYLIIYQPKPAGEFTEALQKSQDRFI